MRHRFALRISNDFERFSIGAKCDADDAQDAGDVERVSIRIIMSQTHKEASVLGVGFGSALQTV